jgi:hypothetical protein
MVQLRLTYVKKLHIKLMKNQFLLVLVFRILRLDEADLAISTR